MVVRDRRRIDPDTGAVRTPAAPGDGTTDGPGGGAGSANAGVAGGQAPPDGPGGPGTPAADAGTAADAGALEELQARLDERTGDLQRITAEYANYRKRVDRDRELVVTSAKAQVVADLLGVLDDLERAEAHGDLTGAFRAVGDKVTTVLQKAGLVAFGHEGEPFDPALHEAVQHGTSPEVSGPTVTAVLRRGYTFGERVLRPAMVAVTDHEPAPAASGEPMVEPEPAGGLAPQDGQGDTAGDR